MVRGNYEPQSHVNCGSLEDWSVITRATWSSWFQETLLIPILCLWTCLVLMKFILLILFNTQIHAPYKSILSTRNLIKFRFTFTQHSSQAVQCPSCFVLVQPCQLSPLLYYEVWSAGTCGISFPQPSSVGSAAIDDHRLNEALHSILRNVDILILLLFLYLLPGILL